MTQQLPITNLLEYPNLKQAILEQFDHTLEQHVSSFTLLGKLR